MDFEYSRWQCDAFAASPGSQERNVGRPRPRQGKRKDNKRHKPRQDGVAPVKKNRRPSRVKRREQFMHVQREYQRNRSKCADSVISVDWEKQKPSLPMSVQDFWRPFMEYSSKTDHRESTRVHDPVHTIARPVSAAEVEDALSGMSD